MSHPLFDSGMDVLQLQHVAAPSHRASRLSLLGRTVRALHAYSSSSMYPLIVDNLMLKTYGGHNLWRVSTYGGCQLGETRIGARRRRTQLPGMILGAT